MTLAVFYGGPIDAETHEVHGSRFYVAEKLPPMPGVARAVEPVPMKVTFKRHVYVRDPFDGARFNYMGFE